MGRANVVVPLVAGAALFLLAAAPNAVRERVASLRADDAASRVDVQVVCVST